MPTDLLQIRDRLWDVADRLRADAQLSSTQYSMPVLGLIFLRYADHRFTQLEAELLGGMGASATGAGAGRAPRRSPSKEDYQAKGVMFLPAHARFSHLLALPESQDIGGAINEAMRLIEEENEDLASVLPKTYNGFSNSTLVSLLKTFNSIPMDIEGDAFGKIYEYFLGKFEGVRGARRGGVLYAYFDRQADRLRSIDTLKLCKMNLACTTRGSMTRSAASIS